MEFTCPDCNGEGRFHRQIQWTNEDGEVITTHEVVACSTCLGSGKVKG